MSHTADFLLEIGSEEMPSAPLIAAIAQAKTLMDRSLAAEGLPHGAIEVLSTPRRLTLYVHDVATMTEEVREKARGPKTSIAFDDSGAPTKAALGFARKFGVSADDLIRATDTDGFEYVFAEHFIPSRPTLPLLSAISEKLIGALSWPRSQRWGSQHQRYVRPIRWILARLGDQAVEVRYADVVSGTVTWGHRVLGPGAHEVANPSMYREVLRSAGVLLEDERRASITQQIDEVLTQFPGHRAELPAKVFNEVVNLTEWPTVLVGRFPEEFLKVPHEIITESMLSNQRYFPIYDENNCLTQNFIIVSNADPAYNNHVVEGNERVVAARLEDAKFFYEEDLQVPLEQFVDKLSTVVFQEKLGTVRQKVERMEQLAQLAAQTIFSLPESSSDFVRAAHLAKADLVSQAVIEFTSQQGVMGGYYAQAAGEKPEVARAIKQQYRPRFAGDRVPDEPCGQAVALSDKLDTVCGIFAIDEPPTGSSDPYAVRRAALGVIAILREQKARGLEELIDASLNAYATQGLVFDHEAVASRIRAFFLGRLEAIAKDEFALSSDTIEAVAQTAGIDPTPYFARAQALETARSASFDLFQDLATAYARAAHLSQADLGVDVDEAILSDSETQLLDACKIGELTVADALSRDDFEAAFRALATLREPIDTFFDKVLVMDEDLMVRNNRLRLLNRFADVFSNVADLSALTHKK